MYRETRPKDYILRLKKATRRTSLSVAVFLRVLLGCTLSALASNKEGYYLKAMLRGIPIVLGTTWNPTHKYGPIIDPSLSIIYSQLSVFALELCLRFKACHSSACSKGEPWGCQSDSQGQSLQVKHPLHYFGLQHKQITAQLRSVWTFISYQCCSNYPRQKTDIN